MEAVLAQSMAPLPVSYKEALGRLEQSKVAGFANLQEDWVQKSDRKLVEAAGNVALYAPQQASTWLVPNSGKSFQPKAKGKNEATVLRLN